MGKNQKCRGLAILTWQKAKLFWLDGEIVLVNTRLSVMVKLSTLRFVNAIQFCKRNKTKTVKSAQLLKKPRLKHVAISEIQTLSKMLIIDLFFQEKYKRSNCLCLLVPGGRLPYKRLQVAPPGYSFSCFKINWACQRFLPHDTYKIAWCLFIFIKLWWDAIHWQSLVD